MREYRLLEDPAPERIFQFLSSIDESGSYPLHLIARSPAADLSSGLCCHRRFRCHSLGDGLSSVSFHREDRIRHHETTCSEGSTSWWIERSSPQQALKCELFL